MQHAIPDSFISSNSAVGSTAEHSSADIFYRMPVPHHYSWEWIIIQNPTNDIQLISN